MKTTTHLFPQLGQFRFLGEVKLPGGILERGDVVRPLAERHHDGRSGHHLTCTPWEDACLGGRENAD